MNKGRVFLKEKVSVIMPVYNGERFIAEAISSVLEQSYENLELIIINDGSTDNTAEVLSSFSDRDRIMILKHHTNKGKVAAINYGIKESTGDLIVLLAADDVLPRNSLERRVESVCSNGVAFCNIWVCDEKLDKIKLAYDYKQSVVFWEDSKRHLLLYNMVGGGAIIFSKNLADKIFPIPEKLQFEDWWITFFALMHAGQMNYLDEPLLLYRIHGNNDNGSLAIFGRDARIKKDFSRHLVFYQELKNKVAQLEHFDTQEFLDIITMNEQIKEKVIEGKLVPWDKDFIRLYGILEYIKLNMISLEISALPSLFVRYIKKLKKRVDLGVK